MPNDWSMDRLAYKEAITSAHLTVGVSCTAEDVADELAANAGASTGCSSVSANGPNELDVDNGSGTTMWTEGREAALCPRNTGDAIYRVESQNNRHEKK